MTTTDVKKSIYHVQMGFSVYIRDDDKPDEDTLTIRALEAILDVVEYAQDYNRFYDNMRGFIETIEYADSDLYS